MPGVKLIGIAYLVTNTFTTIVYFDYWTWRQLVARNVRCDRKFYKSRKPEDTNQWLVLTCSICKCHALGNRWSKFFHKISQVQDEIVFNIYMYLYWMHLLYSVYVLIKKKLVLYLCLNPPLGSLSRLDMRLRSIPIREQVAETFLRRSLSLDNPCNYNPVSFSRRIWPTGLDYLPAL